MRSARLLAAGLLTLASCGEVDERLRDPLPTLPSSTVVPDDVASDSGVTSDSILLGIAADLSGPQAHADVRVVEAHKVYWNAVNRAGGVGGRRVDLVVSDHGSDPELMAANVRTLVESDNGVLAFAHSGGTDTTRTISVAARDSQLAVMTLSRHSGWNVDPAVVSPFVNLCIEAMNTVSWLDNRVRGERGTPLRVAIVGDGSTDSTDAVAGARRTAEDLQLDVVLDETLAAGADLDRTVRRLSAAAPNGVFVAVEPARLEDLLSRAEDAGLSPVWAGSSRTYDAALLLSPAALILDAGFFTGWPTAPWGAAPDDEEAVEELSAALPRSTASEWYLMAWTEASVLHRALDRATSSGDLSRATVLDLVDQGAELGRETSVYAFSSALHQPDRLESGTSSSGLVMVGEPTTSATAAAQPLPGDCPGPAN